MKKQKTLFADVLETVTKYFLILVIVVVLFILLSGIRMVESGNVAVVLRFGKLVGESYEEQIHEPGLLFTFPYFIDEVITIPSGQVIQQSVTTHYTSGKIDSTKGGYLITGDQNIAIVSASVKYTVTDPVAYTTYVKDISKLIDGVYPNYRAVVPTSFARVITLPVEPLLAKVETVSLMLPDATSSVVLNFQENKVVIEASSSELGDGTDFVDVEFADEPFDVSFNPQFLVDPLRITGAETIKFKLNDPLNPVALEAEEGFINVIMPIRKKANTAQ